jgi:hypothetical protein
MWPQHHATVVLGPGKPRPGFYYIALGCNFRSQTIIAKTAKKKIKTIKAHTENSIYSEVLWVQGIKRKIATVICGLIYLRT